MNVKPRVVISKCIEFDSCRYNGQIISSSQIKELQPFIDFLPICPEVEIKLSIPRDPIRIVFMDGQKRLIQPSTKKDVTKDMDKFCSSFLQSLSEVDGFVLKSRSPSCGIKEVKIYPVGDNVPPIDRKAGFFGQQVLDSFSYLPIEDEGRLRNPTIREHFLRAIYTLARFRMVLKSSSLSRLIEFHTQHKFLFMAYNQTQLKELGRIVANQVHHDIQSVLSDYQTHLHLMFQRSPRCTSNINVLMHAYGYFKDKLSPQEKKYFLDGLDQYRNGKTSLASLISVLKAWIIRFDEQYLNQQFYFSPYPDELIHAENIDSCLSRDYWK